MARGCDDSMMPPLTTIVPIWFSQRAFSDGSLKMAAVTGEVKCAGLSVLIPAVFVAQGRTHDSGKIS